MYRIDLNFTVLCWNGGFLNFKVSKLVKSLLSLPLNMLNIYMYWERNPLQPESCDLLVTLQVIKTFLMSQIIYKATVLPNPPTNIINDIAKLIMSFLWNGKQPRIKKEVLYNSYENGGIKLPHLSTQITAIKIGWVKRILLAGNNCVWKALIQNGLKIDIDLLFEINICFKDLLKFVPGKLNTFWTDVLKSWCDYNYNNPLDKFSVQNQMSWFDMWY